MQHQKKKRYTCMRIHSRHTFVLFDQGHPSLLWRQVQIDSEPRNRRKTLIYVAPHFTMARKSAAAARMEKVGKGSACVKVARRSRWLRSDRSLLQLMAAPKDYDIEDLQSGLNARDILSDASGEDFGYTQDAVAGADLMYGAFSRREGASLVARNHASDLLVYFASLLTSQ